MTPGAAGALGVFNRSIGPVEAGRTDEGYLPSLRILDAAERYRGPVSLPDGEIMVARAQTVGGSDFEIVAFNPRDGSTRDLITGGTGARVDAQLVYRYPARKLYENRRQLVFGGGATFSDKSKAVVHMPDAPMLFTILTGNLRRGRPVDAFRAARKLVVYSEAPCPDASCVANLNGIYQNRTKLGEANLASDGSARVMLPAQTGLVFELQDGNGGSVVMMGEEHELGPGEIISMGVPEKEFNAVCGGCHGSVTGSELEVSVTADALTGASQSLSANNVPATVGN